MTQNMTLAYKNNSIQTSSPAELTLMLYDGCIKFCNIALGALEKNDIQKANTNIVKAERIIMEFRSTLDFKYPVAQDFERVYDWIYRRMIEANIKKDTAILEDALRLVREMRDTWKEVMRLSRVQTDKPKIQYISAAQKMAANS